MVDMNMILKLLICFRLIVDHSKWVTVDGFV